MARSTSSPAVMLREASEHSLALNLLISLRPRQWAKNLLVFAGLLFGLRLFDGVAVGRALAAFGIFCLLSGVVYLINDIADRDSDRQHPHKARRPIASGALPVPAALTSAIVLAVVALAGAFALGPRFFVVAALLSGASRALLRPAQAHRHHRRADDRHRVRAARRGRGRRGRRGDQPLAARLHHPAGAVHLAGETPSRARAARRRCGQPSSDSAANTRRTCSIR